MNLTLGLPIIRTSPDHGTAFDIAGKNKADASSIVAAINLAIDLANRRVQAGNNRTAQARPAGAKPEDLETV